MVEKRKKAKSPYARYNKRPHRYSELLRRWMDAVREGRHDQALDLGNQHLRACRARFGR